MAILLVLVLQDTSKRSNSVHPVDRDFPALKSKHSLDPYVSNRSIIQQYTSRRGNGRKRKQTKESQLSPEKTNEKPEVSSPTSQTDLHRAIWRAISPSLCGYCEMYNTY